MGRALSSLYRVIAAILATMVWAFTKVTRPEVSDLGLTSSTAVAKIRSAIAAAPVLTVTGQAGSGKSTAVASSLSDRRAVAWVRLDTGDDDLLTLIGLVAGAVDTVLPGAAAITTRLTEAGAQGLDARGLAGVLVNDLGTVHPGSVDDGRLVLVLDDVHHLSRSDVLVALDQLVTYVPPTTCLVLVGRSEPVQLTRHRATGRVLAVTSADLRLDVEGGEAVLNGRLGLDLAPAEVAQIVESAGGWATGIWLHGRTLHPGNAFDRTVETADPAEFYDYFATEILGAADDRDRELLLSTCVLDELTPASASAVAGCSVGRADLDRLHRDLPFLVVVHDRASSTYRYHDLFAAFLRRRLAESDPGRWRELHRRAATVSDPQRAVEHLLTAGEWDAAAGVLEQAVRDAVPHGARAQRLADLVARLPEAQRERPWLRYCTAWSAEVRGERARAASVLATLHATPPDDAELRLLTTVLAFQTDTGQSRMLRGERALAELAAVRADARFDDLPPRFKASHHIHAAFFAALALSWPAAADHIAATFDVADAAGPADTGETVAEQLNSILCVIDGAADRLDHWIRRVERWLPAGPSLVRLGSEYARAQMGMVRGRWDDALAACEGFRSWRHLYGSAPFGTAAIDCIEATILHARGRHGAGHDVLAARFAGGVPIASDVVALLDVSVLPVWARILRALDRGDELSSLGSRFTPRMAAVTTPLIAEYTELVLKAHIAWAAAGPGEALAPLKAAADLESQFRYAIGGGSARVDLAAAAEELGDLRRADHELSIALSAASRLGLPGLVARGGQAVVPILQRAVERPIDRTIARQALQAVAVPLDPRPAAIPGTAVTVSAREVEILRLLSAGASNRDIAGRLYISEHTVKSHVRSLLAKLDARSRGHAVARARELRLL